MEASTRIPPVFDRESATNFVKDLFTYILNRASYTDAQVDHWVGYLLDHQDAAELVSRFGRSQENIARLAAAEVTKQGFPAGHFYSPIVNAEEVTADSARLFDDRAQPLAIDLNADTQKQIFSRLASHVASMPFTDEKQAGLRYYFQNTSFAFGDAFGYWGMLATFRPSRIIEVGSGFTSALALDAIDRLGLQTTCTFIDPYPALLRKAADPIGPQHTVLAERIQDIDPALVETLQENDILFLDSSHVVKTASDVHFEIMEMLPRLRPGVIVHFHDTFDKFEYPRRWILESRHSWNELYVLQAFLMYNRAFEIIYFNDYFAKQCADELALLPPDVRKRIVINPGGGLWLRKL